MTGDRVPPSGLELRHLRAFVAVATELNVGRAAAALYVSPSSLSRQVTALERMLGCVLMHRSTQRIELTPAGEVLLGRAPQLLAGLDDLVAEVRSVGGELASRIQRLGEPFAVLTFDDVEGVRAAAERHYALLPLAPGVSHEPVVAGGVPALVATPPGAAADPPTVLLLHGGNFVNGSAYGFRSLAGAIATATGRRVLTPDYRLAPEHPYPAAVEDAETALAWLAQQSDPEELVLVGDGSGSALALTALLRRMVPRPGGCVLLTPWVDLTGVADLPAAPAPANTREGCLWAASLYLDGHSIDEPVLDPLRADLTGLPPTLIQAAAAPGRDEAEQMAARLRAHHVDVRLEVYPAAAESFQLYWSFLPEAADALRQLGVFVSRRAPRPDIAGATSASESTRVAGGAGSNP